MMLTVALGGLKCRATGSVRDGAQVTESQRSAREKVVDAAPERIEACQRSTVLLPPSGTDPEKAACRIPEEERAGTTKQSAVLRNTPSAGVRPTGDISKEE